jgi:di/tricarboxylate transporter
VTPGISWVNWTKLRPFSGSSVICSALINTLMARSFATILGGLVTLIGTPPNIVVASFRQQALGEPFGMFDFTPVGGAAALAGLAFVALIGWRLIDNKTRYPSAPIRMCSPIKPRHDTKPKKQMLNIFGKLK